MAESTRSKHIPETGAWFPADMVGFNREAVNACGRAWGTYFDTWSRCGQELLEFATSRMRNSSEMGKSLSKCRTLNETAEVQTRWLKSMYDDYAREASRIIEIMSSAARQEGIGKSSAASVKTTETDAERSSDA